MNVSSLGRPYRRPVRLGGYDYTQADAYFVTLCTEKRELLFGEISPAVVYCGCCVSEGAPD